MRALDLVPDEPLRELSIARADELRIRPVDWVWGHFLPRAALTLVAGMAGCNKTTLALAIAATITNGGRWPDGTRAAVGDALIWSGEDAIETTLLPRLAAMGADLKRAHFVSSMLDNNERRAFNPATDCAELALAASRISGLALVVVDPIVLAVGGDSNTNGDVRRGLSPLIDMAERLNVALVGISHFSKGTAGKNPAERVTGSLAFAAAARVVLAVAKVPEDQGGGRVLLRAKNNLGRDDGGFRFYIQPMVVEGAETVRIVWGEAVAGSAHDILDNTEQREALEERTGIDDCVTWLRDMLEKSGGSMDRRDVVRLGDDAGHNKRRVERASARLRLVSTSRGFGAHKRSIWALPSNSDSTPPYSKMNGGVGGDGADGEIEETPIPAISAIETGTRESGADDANRYRRARDGAEAFHEKPSR